MRLLYNNYFFNNPFDFNYKIILFFISFLGGKGISKTLKFNCDIISLTIIKTLIDL